MNSDSIGKSKKVYLLARKMYLEKQKNPKLELDYFVDNFSDQYSKEEINIAFFVAEHPFSTIYYIQNLIVFPLVFLIIIVLIPKVAWQGNYLITIVCGILFYYLSLNIVKNNLQDEAMKKIYCFWFDGAKDFFLPVIHVVRGSSFIYNYLFNYKDEKIRWGKFNFKFLSYYDKEESVAEKYYFAITRLTDEKKPRVILYDHNFEHNWPEGKKIRLESNELHKKLLVMTEENEHRRALEVLQPDVMHLLTDGQMRGIFDAIEINNEMIFMSFPRFQKKIKPYFIGKVLFFDIDELLIAKIEMEKRMDFLIELKKKIT